MGEKFCTVLSTGENARKKVAAASSKIATAVKQTLGPNGWNAALERNRSMPTITKDGVTVLYDLDFEDKVESMVYELYRDTADNVSKIVGDGTTSVITIADAIIQESVRLMVSKTFNPHQYVEGLKAAVKDMIEYIEEFVVVSGDTEDAIRAVLHVSSASDEKIINLLSEVFMDVGDDGMVIVKDSVRSEDQVFYEDGYVISHGPDNVELFEKDGKPCTILSWTNPYVLVVNDLLTNPQQLVPILEQVLKEGETKQIVLTYTRMTDDIKLMIRTNNLAQESPLEIMAVQMPTHAERQEALQEDYAAFTGAVCADRKNKQIPIESLGLKDLGRAEQVDATKYEMRTVNGAGAKTGALEKRIEFVERDRDAYTGNVQERIRANERLAKLQGSMCCIYPGAKSEPEAKHRKAVIEDCIRAVQAAMQGVVPGGGWTYWQAADYVERYRKPEGSEEYLMGYKTVVASVRVVFEKLCKDIGEHPLRVADVISETAIKDTKEGKEVNSNEYAFDFLRHEVGHMLAVRVMEPVMLVKEVMTQAVSAAGTMLLCDGLLTRRPTEFFVPWKDQMQKMGHLKY